MWPLAPAEPDALDAADVSLGTALALADAR